MVSLVLALVLALAPPSPRAVAECQAWHAAQSAFRFGLDRPTAFRIWNSACRGYCDYWQRDGQPTIQECFLVVGEGVQASEPGAIFGWGFGW
jgi:hypothetical protein